MRCGRLLPPPPTRLRDVVNERDLVEHACRGVVDPEALITHAQTRAQNQSGEYVNHPGLVRTDVNRAREAREELADCVNYLVWELQDTEDESTRTSRLRAIQALAVAYNELAD